MGSCEVLNDIKGHDGHGSRLHSTQESIKIRAQERKYLEYKNDIEGVGFKRKPAKRDKMNVVCSVLSYYYALQKSQTLGLLCTGILTAGEI